MRKIEPEFITGMRYIGASPGVLYHMGGAGEQTVVTGNPALLEGVKGNRFTSLTLHGISTQGSTTGANLLPCSEKEVVTTLKEYKFKNPLPAGGYRVSIKSANRVPAGTTFQCAMKYVDGNSVYRNMSRETKSVIMIATNAVVSFTIYSDTAYNESNGKTTIFTGLMINVGDATMSRNLHLSQLPTVCPESPYPPAAIIRTRKGSSGFATPLSFGTAWAKWCKGSEKQLLMEGRLSLRLGCLVSL